DLRTTALRPGRVRPPRTRVRRGRHRAHRDGETALRALVQRVLRASVAVDGEMVSEIGPGLLVLLGITGSDTESDGARLAEKVLALRGFPEAEGRRNEPSGERGSLGGS